jgi:small subunit ribosomal protein S2
MPALYEARQIGVPTIAIIDTNMDPRTVTYPIPGNDDAISGVEFVAEKLADAAREGLELRAGKVVEKTARREQYEQKAKRYDYSEGEEAGRERR